MDDESHDSRRNLEQKALRNTRALLDKLEREEAAKRQGWKPALALAVGLVVVAVGAITVTGKLRGPKPGTPEQAKCEADYFQARMERIGTESEKWKKDPSLSPADIQKKHQTYQRDVRAAAAKECLAKG